MAPLLCIEGLRVIFSTSDGGVIHAVDGLNLELDRGEMAGLVGESGCGKSAAALALLGLLSRPAGRVVGGRALLDGEDLLAMDEARLREVRGARVALVFQEPLSALNPVMRVVDQVAEAVRPRQAIAEARRAARSLLERVGIPGGGGRRSAYPHQLSGGMRQRVMIAMALAGGPDLIIADEPTTALDPTIQAQVMDLLDGLRRDEGLGVLLITHDLRLAAQRCSRLNVMREGRIIEQGPTGQLLESPEHPYTRELLELARSGQVGEA